MDLQDYSNGLSEQIDQVFKSYPQAYDHRDQHPWLTGALGDPFASIWFIAENPSLTMVERATNAVVGPLTPETQWSGSRGDKLFRQMLVKHDFKSGTVESLGGWHCYITNVIKEADYSNRWNAKKQSERNRIAEIWNPVLAWELEHSKPLLVTIMGNRTNTELQYLENLGQITLPETIKITHYAYIGQRARGKLGPMHPQRVQEYDVEFAKVKSLLGQMSK